MTTTTYSLGLIGYPLGHSLSPQIHAAALHALGINGEYSLYPIPPLPEGKHKLAALLARVKDGDIHGLNVTIPHKVTVMPLLDEIDPIAGRIGAVNTVVNDNGVLRGYNTDASGFLRALLESGVEPGRKRIVLLGAGGAARAIAYILAESKASLTVLNRREELDWAEDIARNIKKDLGNAIAVFELLPGHLAAALEKADVLVNATSLGMSPESDVSPVPAELIKPGIQVMDIVYNPVQTKLLRNAARAGAVTVAGLDMLVWQGALAFEKWTGREAPFALMKKVALAELEKDEK